MKEREDIKELKKEFIERCSKEYREDFIRAVNSGIELSNSLNKTIITLSSGAIFLSMTFISEVVKTEKFIHPILLYLSWITFSSAIIFILLGFSFSKKVMHHTAASLNEMFALQMNFEPVVSNMQTESGLKANKMAKYGAYSGSASILSFIIATILLLTFSFLNVN